MTKKRFFLFFVFLLLISIGFNNAKKVTVKALDEQQTTTFIHQVGRTSSLLLSEQGVVYGWGLWGEGSNISLSKKLITPTNISQGLKIDEDDYFINIFSGEQHCFLLSKKGKVFAMGSGEKRQFGYSDYLFKSTPTDITAMFPLKSDEKISYIACGDDFNIALTSQDRILSFGKKEDSQLGVANDSKEQLVYDITDNFVFQEGDRVIDVKCGASHAIALTMNGYVYVWGSNNFYQLGLKDIKETHIPTRIESIENSVVQIACGRYTSYVLTKQAQLYGFGSDSHGQLATHDAIITSNVKQTPYLMNSGFALESDEFISEIISGYYYAIVKTNLNNYFSFGQNSSGQLANGSTVSTSVPQKIEYKSLLSSIDEIVSISCGQDHCIATTKYGHILAWGSNLQGQLSQDYNGVQANYKMVDITYNFPPIVVISTSASSIEYKNYILEVDAFYLDNEEITDTYYCLSSTTTVPKDNWISFKNNIILDEQEGTIYVHIKIDSKKETYYHVSKAYFLDHISPTIKIFNKENEEILSRYYNSTIFAEAMDNNIGVSIVYTYDGKQYLTNTDTFSFSKDGSYQIYAVDDANNSSATIEFTIDTILPTITQIDNNLILSTSYSTREGKITIKGSEALTCYQLGYKGVKDDFYTALNENEEEFSIKLKKGVNTLTIYDLAGNKSLTYEIIYTPRFFQDTQLLLIVFGSLAALFIFAIILVYTIKNKNKLVQ